MCEVPSGERLGAPPEPKIRGLAELYAAEGRAFGDEGDALARLAEAGVAMAEGWLVRWRDEADEASLGEWAAAGLDNAKSVLLRPLWPMRAADERFRRRVGGLEPIHSMDGLEGPLSRIRLAMRAPDLRASLGSHQVSLPVRALLADGAGMAASADPVNGDPEQLGVWSRGALTNRWRIDRRSMRVMTESSDDSEISARDASRAADLADRAQLVLGYPVEIEWCRRGDYIGIAAVRPLPVHPTFTSSVWRRLALVDADELTVTPLAVDTLNRALRKDDAPGDEERVTRIYGRPYRRVDPTIGLAVATGNSASLARASARAARVAVDVAAPISAARVYLGGLGERLERLDGEHLGEMDVEALRLSLRERCEIAAESLSVLDRQREATRMVLAALEMVLGPLPRECYPALAAPRIAKQRRRVHDKMGRLARRIEAEVGELRSRDDLSRGLRRRWDDLRVSLADVRPRGIDIAHDAIGASDDRLLAELKRKRKDDPDAIERARRDAIRRLRATARARPFGRARESVATSLAVLAGRLTRSKGNVVEGLAEAMLRYRRAVVEAGNRLIEDAVLDEPEDAFYLSLSEIEEALRGEPGAYAARVRLRREDDSRWLGMEPPRRIGSIGSVG